MSRQTFVWGILIAAMAVAAAVAQTQTLATQVSRAGTFTSSSGPQSNGVTGQPYSGQEETQTVQTLADGTHITNGAQKVMHYRDSLGRTRTERTPAPPPGVLATSAQTPPVFIEIADPVAGYRYSFDSISHTARRLPVGPGRIAKVQAPPGNVAPAATPAFLSGRVVAAASQVNGVPIQTIRPDISHEPLGTKTIEGVLAEGTRTTTTYPIGFFGNDRPLTTVSEMWTSQELGMAVLTTTSDPRRGEVTMKLTNVSRAEPDASLFQPPAGYEVVDPQGQPAGK